MGAWNFTIRKAGFAVANEMILSGRLYTAEELLSRGLVDLVVEDGEGEAAIEHVVRAVAPALARHARGAAGAAPGRADHLESLLAIVDQWTTAAMKLTDRDLRLMERLARAQARKAGGADEGAVEEIKRMELDSAWGEERTGITDWSGAELRPRNAGRSHLRRSQPAAQQLTQLLARVGLGKVGVHAGGSRLAASSSKALAVSATIGRRGSRAALRARGSRCVAA